MKAVNLLFMDACDAHSYANTWLEENFFIKIRDMLGDKGGIFFQRKWRDVNDDYYESLWEGRHLIAHYFIERDEMNFSNLTLIDYQRIDDVLRNIMCKYIKRESHED